MPNAKYYAQYVREGRCKDCGKTPLATKLRCRLCADKHTIRNRGYEAEAREAGKCVLCSKVAIEGMALCEVCREKTRFNTSVEGVVYFIAEEGDERYVKIGLSKQASVTLRMSQLQVGNPRKLVLLGTLPTSDVYKLEAYFHHHLAALRVNGEWFQRTPELDALIASF